MKTHSTVLYLCLFCASAVFKLSMVAAPAEPTGHWLGSLKPAPGVELRIALEILSADPDKPDGFMVSLDQGGGKIPLTGFAVHDGIVHLEFKRIAGVFDGKLNADGSELAGEWKQRGGPTPLVFKRSAKAIQLAKRPQEPKRPFPYAEEEVVVENQSGGVTLAGTLTRPPGAGPYPAVVLITGSGPQDRNESLPEAGHKPFLVLADYLTRQGIAVLRCDDRGFAKSTGDFAKAMDADFVADTLAEVGYLRARKEIDPRKIGLIGHSEGGIIASRAAVKLSDLAFIVVLGTIGLPMEEVALHQARDLSRILGLDDEQVEASVAVQAAIHQIIKSERDPATALAAVWQAYREQVALLPEQRKAPFNKVWEALLTQNLKTAHLPWYRDILGYDPRPTLAALKCPVLALAGGRDLQVRPKENLAAIRDALAAGGNSRSKTVELPSLNHLFQACQTGSPMEYAKIEETFNPVALNTISDWIVAASSH